MSAVGGAVHATLERGIVRAWLPVPDEGVLTSILGGLGPDDGRIFERLPRSWWERFAPPPDDPLARSLQRAFDPGRILNPGILGETHRDAS